MDCYQESAPILIKKLKEAGLDGITLTVNSLDFNEYKKITKGCIKQFQLNVKAIKEISKIFKDKTTLNIVVTILYTNIIHFQLLF